MGAAAATASPQISLISPVPALSHLTPLPGEGLPEGRPQMQLPWQGDDCAQTPSTKGITEGAARRSAAMPARRRRNGGLTDPSPGVPGLGVPANRPNRRPASAPALTNGRASNRPRHPGGSGGGGGGSAALAAGEGNQRPSAAPLEPAGPLAPTPGSSAAGERSGLARPSRLPSLRRTPASGPPPAVTEPSLDKAGPILPGRPARPPPAAPYRAACGGVAAAAAVIAAGAVRSEATTGRGGRGLAPANGGRAEERLDSRPAALRAPASPALPRAQRAAGLARKARREL